MATNPALRAALGSALAEARAVTAHVRRGDAADALVTSSIGFTTRLKALHPDRHPGATAEERETLAAAVNVLIAARNAALKGATVDYDALIAQHAPSAMASPPERTKPVMRAASVAVTDVFEDMYGPLGGYGRARHGETSHSPSNRMGSRGSGWAALVRGWSRS